MNLRNTVIAAALALVVAMLILWFVASRHVEPDCASARPCVPPVEALVEWEPASPWGSDAPVPLPEARDLSGTNEVENPSAALSAAEQAILSDGSLDVASLLQFVDDASFDSLVAELRRQGGDVGAARRSEFETLVYSHPSSLDGSVALDVVECGAALCVAELRSNSGEVLDALIRDVTESELFAARAFAELPGSEIYSAGESRRLVFPHDADVTGIVVPDGSLPESAVGSDEN